MCVVFFGRKTYLREQALTAATINVAGSGVVAGRDEASVVVVDRRGRRGGGIGHHRMIGLRDLRYCVENRGKCGCFLGRGWLLRNEGRSRTG